ncbi:MAG TPA: hypothetical protein VNI57_07200 [Candidatus Saccharimonadales bacterium]|nr:hypothetical protein [Candidatus Saccharimonadales bacterium]
MKHADTLALSGAVRDVCAKIAVQMNAPDVAHKIAMTPGPLLLQAVYGRTRPPRRIRKADYEAMADKILREMRRRRAAEGGQRE